MRKYIIMLSFFATFYAGGLQVQAFSGGTKDYENDDESKLRVMIVDYKAGPYTHIYELDSEGNYLNDKYTRYNRAIEGNITYNWDSSYQTLNFDNNKNLISRIDRYGNTVETYKYTDSGKTLVYDRDGILTGAYNDYWERLADLANTDSFYKKELSLLDENGNYTEYDKNGHPQKIYKQNGDIDTYKYDSGGNLIAKFGPNGERLYGKKIYTVEEAEAVTAHGDKFHVSLTYK